MKSVQKTPLLLLLLLLFISAPSSLAQDSTWFDFTAYFRSGFGLDGQGGPIDAFKAPNAEAKYRLGNEAEGYAEAALLHNLKTQSGLKVQSCLMLGFVTPTSKSNDFVTTTSVRQAYALISGLSKKYPDMGVWAGQRYYNFIDVHINDYFPLDMTGFGGGIENISLGSFGKLNLAYLGGSIDQLNRDGTVPVNDFSLSKNTIEAMVHQIPVGFGRLSVIFDVAVFPGETVTNTNGDLITLTRNTGWSAGLIHDIEFKGGSNKLYLFYGNGAAENSKGIIVGPVGLIMQPGDILDIGAFRRYRLTDFFYADLSPRWSIMGMVGLQRLTNATPVGNEVNWITGGIRPVYHFGKYYSIAAELGVDHTSQIDRESGMLFKATLAPQIAPENKIFSRPVLRAFFTYAMWTDEFRGLVAPTSFPTETDGISLGLQMEVWF